MDLSSVCGDVKEVIHRDNVRGHRNLEDIQHAERFETGFDEANRCEEVL
jgi:hypothetical protein